MNVRVQLCIADEAGCGFYRMEEPARVAGGFGVEASTISEIPAEVRMRNDGKGLLYRLQDDLETDVVVLQRPGSKRVVEYIPEFKKQGIAVVVEVDDDLSRLQPQHVSLASYNGKVDPEVHWKNVARACTLADLVTVTTPALAERFGSHGRVVVLPNCVPEAVLDIARVSDGATVGWTGAIRFHPGDLEVTHGGVQLALTAHPDWRFLKIGGGAEIVERGLSLSQRPDQTGPLPLSQFHPSLGMLDIGIAPLSLNAFNEAKSYLKVLEYAAAGVPFVASPTPDYTDFVERYDLGLLAKDRARNWRSALTLLMDNPALRAEMSARGQEIVRAHHTYEGQGWRWCEAWEKALAFRRARTRVAA